MSRARILCFGELLLRLGAPGHALLLQQPRLDVHCGGAEANVGVSLAHFGHEVAMVSTVADNPLGAAVLGELRRHDVDTRHVRQVDGRMGLYFLTTGAIHRPSEVVYDRADSAFALAPADAYDWPRLLEGVQWLHLSGVSPALGADVAQATLAAARAARATGVKVSFDGNYRPKLWQRWQGDARGILHQLFDCADVVFADYRDIGVVLGGEFPQGTLEARVEAAAQQAFAAFPQLQLMACTQRVAHNVDHHSLGAMLVPRSGEVARAPSEELTPIIDRIGGGDAFAAGVLHGLIAGWSLEDTVRFGLAAGCLKHSIPGDFNPLSVADVQACVGDARFDVRR
ncbi:sugar kinase [Xanthomonas sp. WHRI 8391]|uniref:2-dehydro-3-deoxygluconokinase n=1 Tax=Xanthomonas hortorum pv. carotae TaxID=487904 RepID=A0A6V7BNL2_9XANT|nr:sugar kinase [Xanthomonas hortorum]ETC90307.1 2-dehydro-3-deoxygluconokinase [Xanthomonas hortorum pv. carotae str. M081]MBG3851382.1 sugar kinase [Xanthomonas hortorum pv. carotae]UTS74221.1 sugar kinase [Xanthomonas hortorum]CAD0303259.1 2-dehydro-3-deoxygluconokinase [Xanthomonas hortorum pv. carotae]CAD0303265.1 2-dehydro-3-deoxygluconokinase [Xanthomonas hortorum pv. carotae]